MLRIGRVSLGPPRKAPPSAPSPSTAGAGPVPVSLTALLCSPALSWQAALACYRAYTAQPHHHHHPRSSHRHGQRSGDATGPTETVTAEAVFSLYYRLHQLEQQPPVPSDGTAPPAAAGHVALSFLREATKRHSPVLASLPPSLLAASSPPNPCVVLDAALCRFAPTGGSAADTDALLRTALSCERHQLTPHYVAAFCRRATITTAAGGADCSPPCLAPLAEAAVRRWRRVEGHVGRENCPAVTPEETPPRCASEGLTGDAAEAAALATTRAIIGASDGVPASPSFDQRTAAEAGEGSWAAMEGLISESAAVVTFVAVMRLCRVAAAVVEADCPPSTAAMGEAAGGEGSNDVAADAEKTALLCLIHSIVRFGGSASCVAPLRSISEAESQLVRAVGGSDVEPLVASALLVDTFPLIEALLAGVLRATRSLAEVRAMLSLVYPTTKERAGCADDRAARPAAPPCWLLPPVVFMPDVVRAMSQCEAASQVLRECCASGPPAASEVPTMDVLRMFFGPSAGARHKDDGCSGTVTHFLSSGGTAVWWLRRWSAGCVALAAAQAPCDRARVLGVRLASLFPQGAFPLDAPAFTVPEKTRAIHALVFEEFVPFLPSLEEHVVMLGAAIDNVAPGTARVELFRCVLLLGLLPAGIGQEVAQAETVVPRSEAAALGGSAVAADNAAAGRLSNNGTSAVQWLCRVLERRLQSPPHGCANAMGDAALLLRDAMEALHQGATAATGSAAVTACDVSIARADLVEVFRRGVTRAGLQMECRHAAEPNATHASTASCVDPKAATAAAEARSWVSLLSRLPVGAADDVHLTTWLYWMMRAVTHAEAHHTMFDRSDADGQTGSTVCTEAMAMALAKNVGSHLPRCPVDSVAPPMLLNWLVSRVPALSWSQAARVLLPRHQATTAAPTPFVYLALPLNRIVDMSHVLRVLASLRCVQTECTRADPPPQEGHSGDVVLTELYTRVRWALLLTWYRRTTEAVLLFVGERASDRCTWAATDGDIVAPPGPGKTTVQLLASPPVATKLNDNIGAEGDAALLRLLQDGGVLPGQAERGAAGMAVGRPESIKVPLQLLGLHVAKERLVHAHFLRGSATASLDDAENPASNCTGCDGSISCGGLRRGGRWGSGDESLQKGGRGEAATIARPLSAGARQRLRGATEELHFFSQQLATVRAPSGATGSTPGLLGSDGATSAGADLAPNGRPAGSPSPTWITRILGVIGHSAAPSFPGEELCDNEEKGSQRRPSGTTALLPDLNPRLVALLVAVAEQLFPLPRSGTASNLVADAPQAVSETSAAASPVSRPAPKG